MTNRHRRTASAFWATLLITLCVLGLGFACLLIECNMQQTTYGRVELGLSYTLEEGVPHLTRADGEPLPAPLPSNWRQALRACVSAPVRLTALLLRWETDAVCRLWAVFEQSPEV